MKIYRRCFFLLFLSVLVSMDAKVIEKWEEREARSIHPRKNLEDFERQDMCRIDGNIYLKAFSKFNFLGYIPAGEKRLSDKINAQTQRILEKYGKVKLIHFLTVNEKGESAVDFSAFDAPASIDYEIKAIEAVNRKDDYLVKATLNVSTDILIEKTHTKCTAYVWSNSCILKGDLETELESLVDQSLDYLMKKFCDNHAAVNSEKPTFNVRN